jgi:transposase
MGGDRRSKLKEHDAHITALLAGTCDLRLVDIQVDLAQRGVFVSWSTVWRRVKRLGLRLKKNDICDRAGSS